MSSLLLSPSRAHRPRSARFPIQGAGGARLPRTWSTLDQSVVDVSTVLGADHKAVDAYLCGSTSDPNNTLGTLPSGSLKGRIALVLRGNCSFLSKVERADLAGAIGLIMIDNRPGEANPLPGPMPIPTGMIADLDGQNLRAFADANGGVATIRLSTGIQEVPTGRSGVITSFSSAGPTDFEHALKPDVSAPGLDILSSTPPKTTGSTFSVFAGTSMATPHVAGAAALLLQRHPGWAPWQVKSALMGTAQPAWGNTARTQEASVLLEGAGLANVLAADDPKIFTAPQSLSFGNIDVSTGSQTKGLLLTLSDTGDGAGSWAVTVEPQAQTAGVTIDVTGPALIAPGGDASIPIVVHAAGTGATGENTGFVVLTQNGVVRRVPYAFLIERPALASLPAVKLKQVQTGNTAVGTSKVSTYCCPSAPFSQPPSFTGAPMNEDGSEHLYWTEIDSPIANFGVSVIAGTPGALVDPFVLGSKDENDVQGYAGTPTDVNALTYDSNVDIGAAGVQFPRLQRFYIAVDSRADPFTNKPLKGTYILNSWTNDVTPPLVRLLTTRVSAGRPLLVAEVIDLGSGVDPLSLVVGYGNALVGASAYDPFTGLALFDLPTDAPKLKVGKPVDHAPGLRLPGSEEHQHRRSEHLPQHGVQEGEAHRGRRSGGRLDSPLRGGMRREERPPGRDRELAEEGLERALHGRRQAGRSRQGGLRRRLLPRLAHGEAEEGQAHAHGERHRRVRAHGHRDPDTARLRLSRARPQVRVAVVTGASSGIGAELVRALRAQGWHTVGVSRRPSGADEHEECDVGDRAAVDAVAARVLDRHERIDLLVNNAGFTARTAFVEGDPSGIEAMIRRELPRLGVGGARVSARPRPRLAHREHRLGGRRGGRRPVLGVEACAARVFPLSGGRAGAARDCRPHRQARPRRDARLSPRWTGQARTPARGRTAARRRADPRRDRARPARAHRAALVSGLRNHAGGHACDIHPGPPGLPPVDR